MRARVASPLALFRGERQRQMDIARSANEVDEERGSGRNFVAGLTVGALAGFLAGALFAALARQARRLLGSGLARMLGRRARVAFELLAQ